MDKKEIIIIFDETEGKSIKGRFLKRLADNRGLKYVTNIKEFLEELKKGDEKWNYLVCFQVMVGQNGDWRYKWLFWD